MKLGPLLSAWRTLNRMTLRDLAKETGVPLSTISRMERGFDVDGATLAKILKWVLS